MDDQYMLFKQVGKQGPGLTFFYTLYLKDGIDIKQLCTKKLLLRRIRLYKVN